MVQYGTEKHHQYCVVPEKSIPSGRSSEFFLDGQGLLKAKILEAKYMHEAKLEFLEGGCKTKNFPWREYGCFLESPTHSHQTHHIM